MPTAKKSSPVISQDDGGAQHDLPAGVPRLHSFYLYLVTGCNLCCRHCWITPTFVNGEPDPGDCLDVELLKTAVRQGKTMGLRASKLTGGEPMMHPQFKEIARFLSSEGLRLDMETNATYIDADMASFLKNETSIQHISTSLDSVDPAQHDAFRGRKGAFDDTVRGIGHLADAGIHPQVIMSPHRGNIDQVDAMVELATNMRAGSVKFNPVTNAGRGRKMHESGESLDYDEYRRLIAYVNGDLRRKSRIGLFIGAPMALLSVNDLLHDRWRGTCNVRYIMGLLGTGHMALCGVGRSVPELCYGELGKDDLRETWISHPLLNRIRDGLDGDFPGICGDCIHAYRCRTGCLAMNFMDGGELFAPSHLCEEAERRDEFPVTRRRKTIS